MQSQTAEVVYALPDKMGGVFNYVDNQLSHRRTDGLRYAAVLTDNFVDVDTRSREPLTVDRCEHVRYSLPPENIYAVLRRVHAAVGDGPGVLVANGWIELAMATAYDTGRAVVAINHGDFDYYYDLAARHEAVIDAFVTYTTHMYERLKALLPERSEAIHLLRYGVDIPAAVRTPADGPLRALYVGRLSADKGVLDLPAIDRGLRDRGVHVSWTIQGAGPAEAELKQAWSDRPDIRWTGFQPMAVVKDLYRSHDVLVMPCRNEGLPVALLEAGAAGVVPVITDLPSGIPDVVEDGVSGFRVPKGDLGWFAQSVERLHRDRAALEAMSRAVRTRISERYEVRACTAGYQALFARWHELKRPRAARLPLPYGSRLDRPWIPNAVSKTVRRWMGR